MNTDDKSTEQRADAPAPESVDGAPAPAAPPTADAPNFSGDLDADLLAAAAGGETPKTTANPILLDVDALTAAIDRLSQQIAADQDLISRMQSRIETLQGDQVRALLAPAVTELANLHAEFAESAGRDFERLGFASVRQEFGQLSDHIETAIDLLGAVSLDVQIGDPFNSRVHQAIKKVPTGDSALDRTVAAVIRQGFTFDPTGKPMLCARVWVYSYEPLLEATSFAPETTLEPIAQAIPAIPPRTSEPVQSSPLTGSAADDLELPFPR